MRVGQCILPKIEPSGAANLVRMSLFSNVPSDGPYIYGTFHFVKFYSDANAGQNLREMFPIFSGANHYVLILYELERRGGNIGLFPCYAPFQLTQRSLRSEQSERFGDIFILAGLLF